MRALLLTASFAAAMSVLVMSAGAMDMAPTALNSLPSTRNLAATPVFDTHGNRIGTVQSVTPGPGGKPWSVTIALSAGGGSQSLPASAASYDGQKVVADLARDRRG
jgi:hypothetical protein